jgi:hypothetical protein
MTSTGRFTNEGLAGPHSSRVANAADPRVDSDLDSTRNNGVFTTGGGHHARSGATHVGAGSTNAGPHDVRAHYFRAPSHANIYFSVQYSE